MQIEMQDELVINCINFKHVAKMWGRTYEVPHMKAMEQLARVFGYSSFHQVVALVGCDRSERGKRIP